MSTPAAWSPRIALLVISSGLSFLLAECGLRLAEIEYPHFYEVDPMTGARHVPRASGRFSLEGRAFVSINSQGMRDHEHTRTKPTGVYRIAVIGDSYAEAIQVEIEATFWSLLESELPGCEALGDRRAEALNFGVSGFGTAQELLVLQHKALAYEPDLVLLAFVLNDIRDNSRELRRNSGVPYFLLEGGELVLDDSFLQSAHYLRTTNDLTRTKFWLRSHSRIIQLLYEARKIPNRMAQQASQDGGMDDGAFYPPKTEAWAEAWRVTEALVARIHRETREHDIEFLLAVVSHGSQVNPDPAVRLSSAQDLGVEDLYYYEDRILSYAEGLGIANLGLSRPFLRHAESTNECLHGFDNALPCDGHWNELGHRLAAEIMAEAICELISNHTGEERPSASAASM